ncbi:MAG TPA: extracellular solute-binding protein, partial [Candidatus Limnocylindrales bacterium]
MIKRMGVLLAMMVIVVGACTSGGSGATTAPSAAATSAASAAAPSEGAATPAASADAGAAKLLIWADDKRAAAIKPLAQQWATDNGVTVEVQAITENLTTQFKTASQQGTGPDIVVWAHDAVADFVQNSAIDPVTMPDTSMFDPLAVKGMTYQGQLYGVPYSIENIALIRNTDLAPECPATMEELVETGQQLVKDKKVTNIMALQVGQ